MDVPYIGLIRPLGRIRTRRALQRARVWNSLLPCLTTGAGRRSRSLLSSHAVPSASRFRSILFGVSSRRTTSTPVTGAPERRFQPRYTLTQHVAGLLDRSRELCNLDGIPVGQGGGR